MNDDGSLGVLGGLAVLLGGVFFLIAMACAVVVIVSLWKVFSKAGKPGWAILVPIYNIIVLLEIVGKPLWWIVLMLIPFVNLVVGIIVVIELAKSFGKSAGFGIGLMFLGVIFYPILAFGAAQYLGPGGSGRSLSQVA
jgi:hypothetical protein